MAPSAIKEYLRKRQRRLLLSSLIFLLAVMGVVLTNYLLIGRYSKYIVPGNTLGSDSSLVAVVLGGGVDADKPRPLLQDRLDTAAQLLEDGKVRKLLVSGDNTTKAYNEPDVMKKYLLEKGVEPTKIEVDYAGRSTYETCERAKKIYGLNKALFVSESTHLPRVLYLCRSFGIEAYGVSSDGQSSAGLKVGQRFRETLARTKATINVYIFGERTVLGEKIVL
jgi:SanA protein